MPATKITVASRHTDGRKPIFLGRKCFVMVSNRARDRKGKLVAKMDLPKPEGLGLKFIQGSLNKLRKDVFHKN